MSPELGLPSLLAALREAGLTIGVAEVSRLQAVFSRQPALRPGTAALGGVLAAVLVKSAEDRQVFERVFAAWLERAEAEGRAREAPAERPLEPAPRVAGRPRSRLRPGWNLAAVSLLLLVGVGVGLDTRWSPRQPPPQVAPQRGSMETPAPTQPTTPADLRKRTFLSWVPTLTVTPAPWTWTGWPALGLGLLSLMAAGEIWRRLRGKSWVPARAPLPTLPGPPRAFLSPPSRPGAQLLTPQQQETLVWGIGRYTSEEPTRRLDLAATVTATARTGGFPDLRFARARYSREVWLWTDEAADDPALGRLADEIEELLRPHGLPIERAVFRGLPERLVAADGQAFAPNELDERRDVALVAVLTDGRLLGHQWAAADRRVRVETLLRGLSSWPRLAFVDFSDGSGELPRILARHGIPLLAPGELPGFLGGAAAPGRGGEGALAGRHGDTAWAAVCALGPSPVAEETAFELRARLGLATSPWSLRALRREAPGPPGRLHWPHPARVRLLNWLRGAEEQPDPGRTAVENPSLLWRALDAWEIAYDRETSVRTTAAGVAPWEGTPAAEHLLMERALLGLWRRPDEAARTLYRLHRGPLAAAIRQHLSGFVPLGWAREGKVELPWRWESLLAVPQVLLQEMGFGGDVLPPLVLGRSSRLRLGVGLCLGLGLGALAMAAGSKMVRVGGRPIVTQGEGKPAEARDWVEPDLDGWRVTVATRKWSMDQRAPAGSLVQVNWKLQPFPCVEQIPGGGEIWRCSSVGEMPMLAPEIQQSIVVLETTDRAPEVEELTQALLDSGSADIVLLEPLGARVVRTPHSQVLNAYEAKGLFGARYETGRLHETLLSDGSVHLDSKPAQLIFSDGRSVDLDDPGALIVVLNQWYDLTAALHFGSGTVRSVKEVLPKISVLTGDPEKVLLRGLDSTLCHPIEETDANGFTFIRVCPGSFRMGSPESDADAESDENPAHWVTLSGFRMSKYEVTNLQYWKLDPKHRGGPDLPATEVSWDEAKRFCENYGYRLPTEAEWEYACRAGTTTPWSFGESETRLGDYAWFGANSGKELHQVGSLLPNPWGLYDMHGNVWEWVADRYGRYPEGQLTNPVGSAEGTRRVFRGGSFFVSAKNLRCANRARNEPTLRTKGLGFRCAKSL
jgi:formylglycine-generating enzyme required for sulfatase activity